jgi:transposase
MVKQKQLRGTYTREFKEEAVRLVESGLSMAEAARKLGLADQTLFNWVKNKRAGVELVGADSKPVNAQEMEISRLKAELARVKMERDILEKATAYFAKARK